MSHLDPGPLATYNSLADPNLIGYFGNTRMRKHLRKSGLITRNGEIVSETTYRLNMARKEHKKHVREMLAQVIVHKALDMERGRQTQIRKKLEEISKIELVRRIRNERARRGDEELLPYLSPRLPRSRRSSSAPSTQSQRRFRPTSAPSGGADQYPIHIDASTPATQKKSQKEEKSREEIITPTPPKSPRSGSNTPRRWLKVPHDSQGRPFKMSNRGSLALHREEPPMPHRVQVNSNCKVKMHYHGSNIHLDYEKFDPRDHVIVEQQHCGGNTLIVFSEKIEPGSDFEFISKRHYGYPFSLTLYIDGVKDSRVSACCEYRHRMGQKLGSKLGHFSLISISGASPCYKCNLEKKFKKEKPKKEKKEKPPAAKEDQRKIVGLGDDKDTGAAKYKVSVEEEVVYSSDHETYTDDSSSSSGSSDSEGEYSDDSFEEDDDAKGKEKERKSSESEKEVKYLKPEEE